MRGYTSYLCYEIKDNIFLPKLQALQALDNFYIDFTNPKLKNLFEFLSSSLNVKVNYSFSDYIDSAFFNMSFLNCQDRMLKYQLH